MVMHQNLDAYFVNWKYYSICSNLFATKFKAVLGWQVLYLMSINDLHVMKNIYDLT